MNETAEVIVQEQGAAGLITLNRPKALNALSLGMIRAITAALRQWIGAAHIRFVAIRGMGKHADGSFAPFGSFCAGGDIRFFHQAALAGDPALEDFFTEEYRLNHLIHTYPKPYLAFLDGIAMGGGMGIAGHGASHSLRIVTERTKMAMPETQIGLFPDVGGGYFLSRCADTKPGVGEALALTGQTLDAADALVLGLADLQVSSKDLPRLWDALAQASYPDRACAHAALSAMSLREVAPSPWADAQHLAKISKAFDRGSSLAIVQSLEANTEAWAQDLAATLRKRSPLMLQVTLRLIRRARAMSLAEDLRLERDLVHHCFHPQHLARSARESETVEGIRALVIDKDHRPRWQPGSLEEVSAEMIDPFFSSPWPQDSHPLQRLT